MTALRYEICEDTAACAIKISVEAIDDFTCGVQNEGKTVANRYFNDTKMREQKKTSLCIYTYKYICIE